jgi:hypothetical protein
MKKSKMKTLLTTAAILATVSLASAAENFDWSTVTPPTIVVPAAPVVLPTTPPVEKLSSLVLHRSAFENALRAYNGSKVRTKAHLDYVLGLRSKYAAAYKRELFPPAEYDHPYTGNLTVERVADPAAVLALCPNLKEPVGCAQRAKDLSWCKVYVVSDAFINKRPAEQRKLFGYSYENFLRHELAHCNGWPGDHPR